MSVALKAAAWALRFKETKNDSPVHRTPGSFDSPVHRTPGSLNFPVHRTPGSFASQSTEESQLRGT